MERVIVSGLQRLILKTNWHPDWSEFINLDIPEKKDFFSIERL